MRKSEPFGALTLLMGKQNRVIRNIL
jgi:hypothetical protein